MQKAVQSKDQKDEAKQATGDESSDFHRMSLVVTS
jgi:hypothetical protein